MGTLTATDEDAGETFSYTIVGGADAALFSIGGAGSDELILDDGVLDFETQSSYQVIVRVTDCGGTTYDETLTVNVNDLNETPTDIARVTRRSMRTPTPPAASVSGTLTATDRGLPARRLPTRSSAGPTRPCSRSVVPAATN